MPLTKGAQIAIKGALMAAQMALTMTQKIEGPRLDSLDVTTADYGTPITRFWGKRRLEGVPIMWAERLREKKTTSKTKGGKYAQYKYFGTFAVIIADHQIDAVSRIWLDKHLCYDITKAGPISVLGGLMLGPNGAAVKLTRGRNMRIYDGTQTSPDPRMEAWCEDRYGADSCPAYKDVSYIVFEDIPLEKFGNRIPQVTVEAVNDSSTNHLYETLVPDATLLAISKNQGKLLFYSTGGTKVLDLWDIPTRQRVLTTTFANIVDDGIDFDASGRIWSTGGTLGDTLRSFADNGVVTASYPCTVETEQVFCVGSKVCMLPYAGVGTHLIVYVAGADTCVTIDTSFTPDAYFEDLSGNPWAIGTSGSTLYFYDIDNNAEHSVATPGGVTGGAAAIANPDGNFFVIIGTTVCTIDPATITVIDSAVISGLGGDSRATAKFTPPGTALFWGNEKEINTVTLEVTNTINLNDWTTENTSQQWYLTNLHALLGDTLGDAGVTIRYLDRVGSPGTSLADVVSDVATWCDVSVDVADLDQTVPGYSVVQGSGKDMLAPLLDIHDVDARPHDFSVQFIKRGDAAAGTIPVTEFVREGDEPRYQISIKQDTDLPRKVSLSFADSDKDQQKNTVISQRPLDAMDGVRELTIDLSTYLATPGEAQKFSDRYFRRQWVGRENVKNALTAQYLALEPGDVWNLQLDDVTQTHRLVKATLSQGRINTEWERDFPSLTTLGTGTGAEMEGRDDEELYVPSPTKGGILDIPLVQDSHDLSVPQLYYWAGNYGVGDWPGAVVYQNDAGEYFAWNAIEAADKAVWGYAKDVLADADPWVWDRGSSVNIDVKGTLTSSTEAAILASPSTNLAMLGGEMFNFVTATLEGDGTYTLSGLLRGRRGTEWACDDHAIGDEFVLISSLGRDGMGLSDVGTSFEFVAQTLGRDTLDAPVLDLDFTGATLKPYAPANLTAVRDATTGDWAITGVRRTRVGGAWVGGTSIPLSEVSEDYEIVIFDGDGVEVRSLTVTIDGDGGFSATYSATDQATDFGSIQSAIVVKAYQLSDAVGRGFPAMIDGTSSGDILTGSITAGAVSHAVNADVTPVNPSHTAGDTLLCVVMLRGTTATLSCATSGWTAADGITNPTTMNGNHLYLFQNECATDTEADPAITCSGGSGSETVIAVVLRIPGRDTAANFGLGTVSSNASNNTTIAFAQNSPSIDNGNAIIAIGVKNNNPISGSDIGILTGQTAGLDWTHLVAFDSAFGNDSTLGISYAYNDSGSAYTAGTSATMSATYSVGAASAAVYLEVPLS